MASNALVIKSGSFAANKLATVTLTEVIPCTGITLSDSSMTLNTFGTVTLTATPQPSRCTDPVTWASSNTSIATVDDDGVVTTVGLGTVTITATCGTYSASCSITVDNVEITTGWRWGSLYYLSGWTNVNCYVPDNYKRIFYGDQIPSTSTRYRYSRSSIVGDDNYTSVMLPYGVGRIEFIATDVSGRYYVPFTDSTQHTSSSNVTILMVDDYYADAVSSGIVDDVITVGEGADSFGVSLTFKTQYAATNDPDEVAAGAGLKIVLKQAE